VLDTALKIPYNGHMNKLKHTKKTDFQNTLNLDSKSQLAKLLATENVTVQHNNVATASFDVGNRVLTLPIFKIKNKHVYDMLITHECGHALHTKVDDWSEIGSDDRLRMAVNILEDTRIDKIMQKSYPGVVNDYKKGFDVLNDSNFYGLDDNDINELSVLDKINMRSKSLERLDIEFSDDELEIVKKVDNIKTFDDVMTLAKDILAYQEKEDKKQMMNQGDISMSGGNNEDADGEQDSDEHKDDDGEMRNEDSHSDDSKDSESDETERKDDETYNEFQDRLQKLEDEKRVEEEMAKSSMAPKEMQDDDFGITNQQFEKSVQQLTQTDKSSKRAYANLPKAKLENTIVSYKQWFKDFGDSIDQEHNSKYKSEMTNRYSKFKSDSMKTVNYLVKEFEMKKSATAYKRASTSKTGVIDPMMLSKYKFTDDIFKKLTIVPDAKNHGMIILVDWSGSMSDVLPSVIQQLMNLAWFCRKINIPFEVYAFSNYYRYDYDTRSRNLTESFDLKSGDINMKDFKLVNFLSHKMNNQDFEHGMLNMYLTLECVDYRGYSSKTIIDWSNSIDGDYIQRPISLPSCMHLGSTPLNQALATMIDIIPKFKSKYNIEKLSFITLTDGASDSGEGIVDDITYDEQNKNRQIHTKNVDGRLVINVKGKNYDLQSASKFGYGSERMTTLLLEIIKQKFNTNNIGFFLIAQKSRRNLTWAVDSYDSKGNYTGYDLDSVMKDLTKDNVHLTSKSGYDKYFITVGNTKVQSADLTSLDSGAKTSDIKRLFRKSMTGRLKSRVLLNNFIEEVA
jgi:hypothetical protein